MMQKLKIIAVIAFIASAGCFKGPGDMLISADGSVIEGTLESISAGRAVFNTGTVEAGINGRVWLLNGETHAGEISYRDGEFKAGSVSIPSDSVLIVIWDDADLDTGIFQVDAAEHWQDTGIDLEQGEMLSIQANGTVITETGTSTPLGQEKYSSSVALAPGATSGQLVFRIGLEGTPVAAGADWVGESPGEGRLQLAVNVPVDGSNRAAGIYTVHVSAGGNGRVPGTAAFYPASR